MSRSTPYCIAGNQRRRERKRLKKIASDADAASPERPDVFAFMNKQLFRKDRSVRGLMRLHVGREL